MPSLGDVKLAIESRLLELHFPQQHVEDVTEMILCLTMEGKMELLAGNLLKALRKEK